MDHPWEWCELRFILQGILYNYGADGLCIKNINTATFISSLDIERPGYDIFYTIVVQRLCAMGQVSLPFFFGARLIV